MNSRLYNYFKGIGWFILALVSSVVNDVLSKEAGLRISSTQVAFLRFLFSALTLVPFIMFIGVENLKSKVLKIHIVRGVLLFGAISSWTYGLTIAPVVSATIISFSIPLITLVLACLILNEKIRWYRWIATIFGFCGVLIALRSYEQFFNLKIYMLILSACAFALLDIINKKFVNQESMLSMLFYSAIFTVIAASPSAYYSWQPVSFKDLSLMFILGCSANLILYFLLKSFALVDASAVAPYRYIELIFSAIAGFVIFNETPHCYIWYGGIILVMSITFIFYSEKIAINKLSAKC